MERNQNDNLDSGNFGGSTTGAGSSGSTGNLESGYEGSGAGSGGGYGGSSGLGNTGSQGYGAGSSGGSGAGASGYGSTSGSTGEQSLADKAKSGLGGAREKASELKATLADKLEAGAQKLRSQQQGGQFAGAGAYGESANVGAESGRMGQVNDKLAQGMQSTADFIRNADLDSVKSGIEKQVRENPGRTLLIAAGIGYLLGKAFKK